MAQNNKLGIDVSKADFHVCLLVGSKRKHKRFANSLKGFIELLEWLGKLEQDVVHACMEPTGSYNEALAEFLFDHGQQVSIVNPRLIKAFAESELARAKTDKADADRIARFCLERNPPLWEPMPERQRLLRDWVRRLDGLIDMRQTELNRLEAITGPVAAQIQAHVETLSEQIEETRKRIRELIDDDPDLRRQRDLLQTIPGIGEATISVILAEFGNINRFTSAKVLAAWVGLAPRLVESGRFKGRTMLCRTSRGKLRKAFFMPALVAMRHNPVIVAMKERLLAAHKPKMAIVGAAMRKLVHLIYGVLKPNTPFDAEKASPGLAN